MEYSKCPICKSAPVEPINLKCDHHPCFSCASNIMTVDQQIQSEIKYKIVCPICKKKTLTYDIRHLIINATEQEQDLYCTTKFLAKKPQVEVTSKINNYVEPQKVLTENKRKSFQNIMSPKHSHRVSIECKYHPGKIYQSFCQICLFANKNDPFFCSECEKLHSHNTTNINLVFSKLSQVNEEQRNKILPSHQVQIKKMIKNLQNRKETLSSEYESLYKQLNQEFKNIYQTVNTQYETLKKNLKSFYQKQSQNTKNALALAQRLDESLKGLEKVYTLDNSELNSQISFYTYFQQISRAIENNTQNLQRLKQIPVIVKKASVVVFSDKLMDICYQSKLEHKRKNSKACSPVTSPRIFNNLGEDGTKVKKIRLSETNILKQNMCPSPKTSLNLDSLISGF